MIHPRVKLGPSEWRSDTLSLMLMDHLTHPGIEPGSHEWKSCILPMY